MGWADSESAGEETIDTGEGEGAPAKSAKSNPGAIVNQSFSRVVWCDLPESSSGIGACWGCRPSMELTKSMKATGTLTVALEHWILRL